MPLASYSGSSGHPRAALFAIPTLEAWTTTAFLFFLLKRFHLTLDAPLIAYSALLSSLLPWLSGLAFWIRVRKRAKLGIADRDATSFSHRIILNIVGAGSGAMLLIEILLLWVLTRVK